MLGDVRRVLDDAAGRVHARVTLSRAITEAIGYCFASASCSVGATPATATPH